ncbi:glycogen synthase [Salsipaludibacter albus]|uniref:glycogen synthase n=1 Tax=Salsipaludibacter albus TaxID=2849650 RepID=UPI001EE46491|nr:glycogen synthase [Salsipaludibacter albus]MBY5162692.1 glycogen synthase [Salsipaludibacter albus]
MTTPHVGLLTREYPPDVYGGAGVHAEELARHLATLTPVTVHCWGDPRPDPTADDQPAVVAHGTWDALAGDAPELAALRTMATDLSMVAATADVDLVHSHTWYANLAGHLSAMTHDVPHVVTTHSLEPLRPWKAEQLGGGYALSSWCERLGIEHADAVIAVSGGMRDDVLSCYPAVDPDRVTVIHNGIDTQLYAPDHDTDVLTAHGLDPDAPTVLFVGRITRQKGLPHLLDAVAHLDPAVQVVLCAGAPDTRALGDEVAATVAELQATRGNVTWIEEMLPKADVVQLLTHADVFVCPSIYEPMGIVNLEAMACETAVVASAVGGIPEVVVDGQTGLLVDYEPGDDDYGTPRDPEGFARDLASAITALVDDPDRAAAMGAAGRQRAVEAFSWSAIAQRTLDLYRALA